MSILILLCSLIGLAHANPPTATTVSAPAPTTQPVTKPWYGWMIVDDASHSIVFLPAEKTLDLTTGIVVQGVLNPGGSYTFKVPSAYVSEFIGVIMTPDGNISALKPISDRCLLAVQPAGIPDESGNAKTATALGVTGLLLKAYIGPNVPTVYIGTCPKP